MTVPISRADEPGVMLQRRRSLEISEPYNFSPKNGLNPSNDEFWEEEDGFRGERLSFELNYPK